MISVTREQAGTDPTRFLENVLFQAGRTAATGVQGIAGGETVHIGSGSWEVNRPLFVPPGVDIEGDGRATRLVAYGMTRHPVLTYGLTDPLPSEADRPDLFGILDASACPMQGSRRGFSTAGGAYLQAQYSALNLGRYGQTAQFRDYWKTVDQLTIDLLLVVPGGGLPPSSPILGCGESCDVGRPRPFVLQTHPTEPGWYVLYVCDDRAWGEEMRANSGVIFKGDGEKVQRISIQLDFRDMKSLAWVNGDGVPCTVNSGSQGHKLRKNEDWPFLVGRSGMRGLFAQAGNNFTLGGFRVEAGLRYVVPSPDSRQHRLDGGPINDQWQFFSRDDQKATVGYFDFADPVSQRWLTIIAGDGMPEPAMILRGIQAGSNPNRLSNIAIWSRGPAVQLGAVLNFEMDHVWAQGEAAPGVGSFNCQNSYPVSIKNCQVDSSECPIYGYSWSRGVIEDVTFRGMGDRAVRLRESSVDVIRPFLSHTGPQATSFAAILPGQSGNVSVRIERPCLDTEGAGEGFSDCVIEAHQQPGFPAMLAVTDLEAANTATNPATGVPVVRLRSWPGGAHSEATIDGVVTSKCDRVVRSDYIGWKWTVSRAEKASAANPDSVSRSQV